MNFAVARWRSDWIRRWAAGFGGLAVVAMAALGLQTNGTDVGNVHVRSAGAMQTGVTTSQAVETASVAPSLLATSVASPTLKATPEWGQPAEP
jgi:hypothetical protein